MASFVVPDAALIPLQGLVSTGYEVSISTFSTFHRVAVKTGVMLRLYRNDPYAANGKTIKTFGIVERVLFQLGGKELESTPG